MVRDHRFVVRRRKEERGHSFPARGWTAPYSNGLVHVCLFKSQPGHRQTLTKVTTDLFNVLYDRTVASLRADSADEELDWVR